MAEVGIGKIVRKRPFVGQRHCETGGSFRPTRDIGNVNVTDGFYWNPPIVIPIIVVDDEASPVSAESKSENPID
ncbi:hypothetical protein [Sphingomonas faeni]|uniref:hypothetical protein n=1 Tax=Sphingomonas faeni TaxID=185950 RepID=UPI00334E5C3A